MLIPLDQMPLTGRHWYIAIVASMEQLIGAALSTIAGIMLPLIHLLGRPEVSATEQGVIGASGLVGIATGSMIMGRLMDSLGYLMLFRLCPAMIVAGSVGVFFSTQVWDLTFFLFLIGLGVGGGYSLDSGYISELMPDKWRSFFVGLAKATCAGGFIGAAALSYLLLLIWPEPQIWPNLIWIVGALGLLTFVLRLKWYQSPQWLMSKGDNAEAQKAAREFFGSEAEVLPPKSPPVKSNVTWLDLFRGQNFKKVMLSGVTWACEGLGVYGFGVFLPILVMALGLQGTTEEGIPKVLNSVRTTVFINLFIACGFVLGLAILHKVNILRLMGWCFVLCALSLGGLLAAYAYSWPVWISFVSFMIFETALNAGPHLVTYIVPARIYPVEERGAGTGIATMLGKVGAVLGVFFMPALLKWGGVELVLWVSIVVQLLGAAVTFIYGKSLKLL